MAFDILFRDDWLCAIAKPPGILVHRSNIATDREFVMQNLRDQLGKRVWPVHRLDRATSGVLLFALDPETARRLGQAFVDRHVDKRYLAVVRGWTDEAGTIDHPVARHERAEAREARTHYRRLATCELPVPVGGFETARYSLVEARPETGRRHQIRRHFKHISHHLIGDTTYGDGRHNRLFREHLHCHRMLLHASRLEFDHPREGRLEVTAPLAGEFARLAEAVFGWTEGEEAV
ncbi:MULTISPECIES: pseudouridine synthase [unclassified Wenzhouxiangella]|uniref:pseudouridine synthase n=1 Tax=unclassified Wenzhouxiangella TaxID=2613841 RepID=UPI000E325DC9|nr:MULTISPECIES: pseudouridine synthase [unclassified Wenzhouxiangella]RFF27605.1 pseudouridylate synthase [Wenzhouxiangella sp. 15181]RFP70166.1 pseudouridylate synthase [Wenzhouxiangella sp. 15190]